MRSEEDDRERSSQLAVIRERISDINGKLAEVDVQLIWDRAVRELHHHEAWRQLAERMQAYREQAVEYLASRRVDPYELGQVQGRLAMLRILTQPQPIPGEQVDRIRQYANSLQEQLAEQLEDERLLLR